MKKLSLLLALFLMVSCNSQSYDHKKIREQASFPLWLPLSVPDTYQFEKSTIEDDSVFVRFASGDKWIEMYQHKGSYSSTQTELRKYIQTRENAFEHVYEVFETNDFVGFLNKSSLDSGVFDYIFVNGEHGSHINNYYKVQTNISASSFEDLINSMKK